MIKHPGKPDGWMEPEDFFVEEEETGRECQDRDVVIRFYRHKGLPASCEIEVKRNNVTRTYNNPNNARINALHRLVKKHDIELEVDFLYYTEISFRFDYQP